MKSNCDISLKRWLTEIEAISYTGLSRSSLQKARMSQGLPFREVMGKILYDSKLTDKWIEENSKLYNPPRK